ncbi:MAG: hypothetical protein LBO06_07850 [Bacteroidales bacterium]|jgi:hypothetical protein|nr:hypothetical protein [Bacteroidales bacterium]
MKKLASIIAISLTLGSCSFIGNISKEAEIRSRIQKVQKEEWDNNKHSFIFKNGIWLSAMVNGKVDTILFDSGVTSYFIMFDTSDPKEAEALKSFVIGAVNAQTIYRKPVATDVETDFFKWTDHVATKIFTDVMPCEKKMPTLLGTQALAKNNHILLLDFDKSEIQLKESISKFDIARFFEVKSLFNRFTGMIYIYLTVNGKELKFIFDTGNTQQTGLMIDKMKQKRKEATDVVLEGVMSRDVHGAVESKMTIKKSMNVGFANKDTTYCIPNIAYTDVSFNNAGIDFISLFNWVIDFKNKKLYAQYRSNYTAKEPFDYATLQYRTAIIGDKLVIAARNKTTNPPYKLNATIKSVNGEQITADNACYYTNLLNQNVDWSPFDVEVEE